VQKREIEALKATIERLKPTKRRKVVPDPNAIFATIEDIHRAQKEAGRFSSDEEEEEEEEDEDSEDERVGDCIVASG
jgi:hypothetical protein